MSATGTPGANASRDTRPDEIVGQHFSRFYTPEDREAGEPDERWKSREAKVASRRKRSASARTARASGPASSSIAIRDEGGELIGFAKITRDITERVEAAARAREGARGLLPVAEDGGARPAHRRHRARLQQPADGGAEQPRAAAQAPAGRSETGSACSTTPCRAPSAARR